ncbi:glycosyltransferase family protein [Rhizobium brockwellii]
MSARRSLPIPVPRKPRNLSGIILTHPDKADAIAKAGQARTLKDHTYRSRMEELMPILARYLEKQG